MIRRWDVACRLRKMKRDIDKPILRWARERNIARDLFYLTDLKVAVQEQIGRNCSIFSNSAFPTRLVIPCAMTTLTGNIIFCGPVIRGSDRVLHHYGCVVIGNVELG